MRGLRQNIEHQREETCGLCRVCGMVTSARFAAEHRTSEGGDVRVVSRVWDGDLGTVCGRTSNIGGRRRAGCVTFVGW